MTLDAIDKQIISMLQENGRRSCSEIADKVGRRRVRRLVKEGIIKRFTIVLDPLKIGMKIRAIIRVKTLMKQASEIANQIKEYDEVNEAYFLDGACGLMLKITVDDLAQLRQFLETRLGKVPGVGEVETCIVLEDIKAPF
ncbi:MAG: Lrp/AsnC family transcriptional regulator [Candidatus Thorarchaeota archaeon]|jgi:Lrp/AsnC family transcriptional regulator for asnA, asnC and gidA